MFLEHSNNIKITNRTNVLPGIDVRSDNGYIVAPPSLHASGNRYEWMAKFYPFEIQPAELPNFLLNLIIKPQKVINNEYTGHILEGTRNDSLASIAGKLRAQGKDYQEILEQLLKTNQTDCYPPLEDDEVKRIASSICKYKVGETVIDTPEFNLTDIGNAKRLIYHYGYKIKYCHEAKSWLIWDENRWIYDKKAEIMRMAKEAVRLIYNEAKKYA